MSISVEKLLAAVIVLIAGLFLHLGAFLWPKPQGYPENPDLFYNLWKAWAKETPREANNKRDPQPNIC